MDDSIRYLEGHALGEGCFWLRGSRPRLAGVFGRKDAEGDPGAGAPVPWALRLAGPAAARASQLGREGQRAGPRRGPAAAPFRPGLTQDWVAQQETSASLFCFAALARGLGRGLGSEAAGEWRGRSSAPQPVPVASPLRPAPPLGEPGDSGLGPGAGGQPGSDKRCSPPALPQARLPVQWVPSTSPDLASPPPAWRGPRPSAASSPPRG